MDRRAWQATVHGVIKVGHDLVIKPPSHLLTDSTDHLNLFPLLVPFVTKDLSCESNYMQSPKSPGKTLNHSIFRTTSCTCLCNFLVSTSLEVKVKVTQTCLTLCDPIE